MSVVICFCVSLDGSLSDTAVGPMHDMDRGSRLRDYRKPASERGVKISTSPSTGMGKKSNSTSQLSATGNMPLIILILLPNQCPSQRESYRLRV